MGNSLVKTKTPPSRDLKRMDLPNEDDFKNMIAICKDTREKSVISLLFESGARRGKIWSLNIQHVKIISNNEAYITVNGKTGTRKILLIHTVLYLQEWLKTHPYLDKPEAPLFINIYGQNYGRRIGINKIGEIVRSVSKRASINKKIFSHLFRHGRFTTLGNVLTEQQMRIASDWTKGSK